MGKAYGEMKRS